MKNKIKYILLFAVSLLTLIPLESIAPFAIMLITSCILICFVNTFDKVTGLHPNKRFNTALKLFVPVILCSTTLYLITNFNGIDAVFNLPDYGIILNILFRGILYVIYLFLLATSEVNYLYMDYTNPNKIVKSTMITALVFGFSAGVTVVCAILISEYAINFTILETILTIGLMVLYAIANYFLQLFIFKKINRR